MALIYDTFGGVNVIIAGNRNRMPGTPQVVQEEKFPGLDGARGIHHGTAPREIAITGFFTQTNVANLLAGEIVVQALIGTAATLVRNVGGATVNYGYCRLVQFYTAGPIGTEPGTGVKDRAAFALFRQEVW